MAVRIFTSQDLYRPYGLLSEGTKGRFEIARALGNYAVFDEFGSGLPLSTVKVRSSWVKVSSPSLRNTNCRSLP